MGNSGEQKENILPTKEQRIQSMLDLSSRFGGVSKIPEEELSAISYVRRVMKDGTVRLMPYERMIELAQKDPDWEKPLKERERPFERVAVELPTAENSFRFIPRTQRQILSDRLKAVEYAFYPNWYDGTSITEGLDEINPRLHNLRTFSLDFLDYLSEEGIDGRKIPEEISKTDFLFTQLPERKESEPNEWDPDDPNNFSYKEFSKKHSEIDGSVSSGESKQMYDELTRLGGYFGDVTELTRDFQNRLAHPIDYIEQSQQEFAEYLQSRGIYTYADFIRYAFPRYLNRVGLPEMGAVIGKSATLHTIADTLQYMDASDSTRAEEQELRKALKTASPEERNGLSKQLKALENAKKRRKQIRQGVIDYFSAPQVYVDVVNRKVKEAQDFLVAGKGEQKGRAVFYLDATPNEELDKDPGVVSGDCTAGKPLPFDRPDIPLYNVKVFAGGNQHVGNMYLLVTNISSGHLGSGSLEKKKVWHFDAIQIPKSGINWQESLDMMIGTLAQQAESKNVDAITANDELYHISNYHWIADAVENYWDAHGRQVINVTIPQVEETGRSSFQGTGNAIVLWSKEKLSDSYKEELEGHQELFDL